MSSVVLSLVLCVLLAHYGSTVPFEKKQVSVNAGEPLDWWQQSVVYQIYPRSFQDSDGDGVGDLNGITSKLDYFVELDVHAIWISPIYQSPMKDFGYDISNFTNIEPVFGTLDDFKTMAAEFRKRDISLVMDFVPNHSSDLHEWFIKSVQNIEPYTDYYVWKNASGSDSEGKPLPPNNWVSVFGGSAWEYNEQRGQFYLHQFVKEQPDLNFENIAVRNEMLAAVKFWLDMGVDGFRVDAVPHMYEDQRFLDEPENPNRDPEAKPDEHRYWDHIYTFNQPDVLVWLADMRQLMDIYSSADGRVRCMMVEATVSDDFIMDYYGTEQAPIAHFPFNFHLLGVRPENTAKDILGLINVWFDLLPEGRWGTFLIGNHDNKRAPTRWTVDSVDGANMINLLLQGTSVTYYGEELGMTDTFLTWEETVDPAGCNTDPDRYEFFSRDPARTPMQWNSQLSAGFSTSNKTWLPLNTNYATLNVAVQNAAPESHLKVYKELMKIRYTDVWRYGDYQSQTLNNDSILAFTRSLPSDGTGLLVLVSFASQTQTVDASSFNGLPASGEVLVRSVGFQDQDAIVGSIIDIGSVQLGPRNSIVIQYTPV